MRNFVETGNVADFTATEIILPGAVVPMNAIAGVAKVGGAVGEVVAVELTGVYTLDKTAPLVINQGDKVYWDTTTKKVTKTASGNINLGHCWTSALSADTEVNVRLCQF